MADGIAPAVDKVGAPEPTAPEALAGAPTLETAKPEASENPPAQAEPAKEPPIIAETKAPEGAKPAEPFNIVDAFKLAHQIPRPVEVQSVPETPVNRSVNGSPKPELNIPMEPEEPPKPQEEPVIITRVQEPLPTPTASIPNSDIGPDSIVDKPVTPNGESKTAEMAGALQTGNDDDKSDISEIIIGKRKLAEIPAEVPAASSAAAEKEDSDESEPADKKAKIDEGDASTNGGAPRKPGRPKKSNSQKKTAPPVVGKTARKTRSQGPVEV